MIGQGGAVRPVGHEVRKRRAGARMPAAASQMAASGYTEAALARYFDCEHSGFRQDVDFFLDLLSRKRRRGPVLDAGCGTGRVAIPLAEAGLEVLGIDSSEAMLRLARKKRSRLPADVASRLRFSRQDLTRLVLRQRFAAAVLAFSTFNLLTEAAGRRSCLAAIADHLLPGGLLVLDLLNPRSAATRPAMERQCLGATFVLPPYGHLVERSVEEHDDPVQRTTTIRYHFREQRSHDRSLVGDITSELTVARLQRTEVEDALYDAGLVVDEVLGDYRGRPQVASSPRMIFLARPPV